MEAQDLTWVEMTGRCRDSNNQIYDHFGYHNVEVPECQQMCAAEEHCVATHWEQSPVWRCALWMEKRHAPQRPANQQSLKYEGSGIPTHTDGWDGAKCYVKHLRQDSVDNDIKALQDWKDSLKETKVLSL